MKEIEYEVTRNSSVDEDELDRYAVYRLLLLSFEDDVRSKEMKFDDLLQVEKVAADICRPFIRLSSLDLKLGANCEKWKRPPDRKKKLVRPLSVFRERKVEKGVCPVCGKRFTVDEKRTGRKKIYCSMECRVMAFREKKQDKEELCILRKGILDIREEVCEVLLA